MPAITKLFRPCSINYATKLDRRRPPSLIMVKAPRMGPQDDLAYYAATLQSQSPRRYNRVLFRRRPATRPAAISRGTGTCKCRLPLFLAAMTHDTFRHTKACYCRGRLVYRVAFLKSSLFINVFHHSDTPLPLRCPFWRVLHGTPPPPPCMTAATL